MGHGYQEFVALSVGLKPGHAEFIECPDGECFIGVVGKCVTCEGFYLKCGCKIHDIACICGNQWEQNDSSYQLHLLEEKIAQLEAELVEARKT